MNIFVLNESFEAIDIIDAYESVIWTDRYNAYGEFEIYAPFSKELLDKVKKDYYLVTNDSEHTMIVEGMAITSDAENGNNIKITGKSLESILNRRILWTSLAYTGSLQNAILDILNKTIINPSISDRRISNFIFEASTDSRITNLTIEDEYIEADNVYSIIESICKSNSIGFMVRLNSNNQFVFKLYMGEDRSYDQLANPYVVFSPKYENIINTNYIDSYEVMKNVTLVAGEQTSLVVGSGSGLARREIFTDARDVQPDQVADYNATLRRRGALTLWDNSKIVSFEGEVEATKMFVYGESFFMGDVVQIANEYGIEGAARVVEFIHSEDANGYKQYPTFEAIYE